MASKHIDVARDGLSAHLPSLRIVVIGAGIGGLATAIALIRTGFTNITIYEQTSVISEVGAGIQVAPNFARLLRRWGCLDRLEKDAIALRANSLRRYEDDTELGMSAFMPAVEEKWGAPLWVVHRADVQRVLLEYAKELGVDVQTGHHVEDVDFGVRAEQAEQPVVDSPRVYLKNRGQSEGKWVTADVILAGDGIRSNTRLAMMKRHGLQDRAEDTGDAAYRILIPRSKLEDDPELLKIIDEPVGRRWMGPGGHIMAYPLRSHQLYNMVLLHPARSDTEESWTSTGPRKYMDKFYASWSPTVRKLLARVEEDEIPEWTLRIHKPLDRWVEGAVALLGDACHPTLPYVAQGAAQAVEDAAVLAAVLALTEKKEDIHQSLLVYSEIRKARAEAVVASASKTKDSLHLPDGPEQISRDEKIAKASQGQGANPDLWGDKSFQAWIWGMDIQQRAVNRYHDTIVEALALNAIYHPNVDTVGHRGL